jgi:hypothetical protein
VRFGAAIATSRRMSTNDNERNRKEQLMRRIREVTRQFETADEKSLFSALEDAGVVLPDPDDLDDAQTNLKLWEVINALADLGVFLHSTDHLSDRELYAYLWSDALVERVKLTPDDSSFGRHIDATWAGDENPVQVYLKYYADERERRRHAVDFPAIPVPEHCDSPYDRDRLLPDG